MCWLELLCVSDLWHCRQLTVAVTLRCTVDILQVEGKYQHQPAFPYVAGAEFSGVVSSDSPIPKGCTFKKGDRVFGVTQGAFAQRCAVDWRRVLPVFVTLSLAFQHACLVLT